VSTGAQQQKVVTTTRGKLTARMIAAGVLGAVLVVFAVLNSQDVRVHWLVTSSTAPLIIVIVICGAVGFAVGWLVSRRSARNDRD
jgi:uncharacterized integral membrane protein